MQRPKNNPSRQKQKLSILVAQDGLSFCVSQNRTIGFFAEKKFSSQQSPENLLKEINHFFTYEFDQGLSEPVRVKVFYAHSLYTVVPRPFFDETRLSDYLKYNARLLPTDELSFDSLKNIGANLVFIPYTNINNYLFEKFGEFTYQHLVSHFIDYCLNLNKSAVETVYLNVFATHFDMAVFRKEELILCNSFDYFSPEDFVYYVLFAFQQLGLNKEKLELHLSGAIDKSSEIYQLLYTYVRHVDFTDEPPLQKITDKRLKQLPSHHHTIFLKTI